MRRRPRTKSYPVSRKEASTRTRPRQPIQTIQTGMKKTMAVGAAQEEERDQRQDWRSAAVAAPIHPCSSATRSHSEFVATRIDNLLGRFHYRVCASNPSGSRYRLPADHLLQVLGI